MFTDVPIGTEAIRSGPKWEVYELPDNKVIKLYKGEISRALPEHEVKMTEFARELGVDAPFVHGVGEEKGRFGVIFDKVIGPTYLEWMIEHPTALSKTIRLFAFEQNEIHHLIAPELPDVRSMLLTEVSSLRSLPKDMRSIILDLISSLPDGNKLCHWNYSPNNIIMSLDGPVVLDWEHACRGDILADVARTRILLSLLFHYDHGLNEENGTSDLIQERFVHDYTQEYMKICGKFDSDLGSWIAPVAAARMAENIPGEQKALMDIIERQLATIS